MESFHRLLLPLTHQKKIEWDPSFHHHQAQKTGLVYSKSLLKELRRQMNQEDDGMHHSSRDWWAMQLWARPNRVDMRVARSMMIGWQIEICGQIDTARLLCLSCDRPSTSPWRAPRRLSESFPEMEVGNPPTSSWLGWSLCWSSEHYWVTEDFFPQSWLVSDWKIW